MRPSEREILEVGSELVANLAPATHSPLRAADERAIDLTSHDASLRAALFRFVDVVPACRSLDDLASHLVGFLGELEPRGGADRRRPENGRHPRRAGRARLGCGGRRPPHGAPLHRRRGPARGRRAILQSLWRARHRHLGRPAGRGDGDRRGGRPLCDSDASRRSRCSPRPTRSLPSRPALEADSLGRGAAGEPVGQGVRADAAAAPGGARARPSATRRRACAGCCARRRTSAPTCTSTWSPSTLARRSPSSCSRSCSRARVPRRSQRWARAAGIPARLARAVRAHPRVGRHRRAAHGRSWFASSRARTGITRSCEARAAWLELAGVRGEGRDATATSRRSRSRCSTRRPLVRPAIASHNMRSVAHAIVADRDRGAGAARRSSSRCCAASATNCSRRSPPTGAACARTARSATSSPAWPTSCAVCSRTPPTRASSPSRRAAGRSRSSWPRHEPGAFANEPLLELRRAPCARRCSRRMQELDGTAAAARRRC